jgi:kynurenine formamidase
MHVLALNAMGIHLFDYLWFEELARHCEQAQRWEFLFAAAPLRVTGATGSPVNPTAIF